MKKIFGKKKQIKINEDNCNNATHTLQDLRVETRDVDDFKESQKLKKEIKTVKAVADEFCED